MHAASAHIGLQRAADDEQRVGAGRERQRALDDARRRQRAALDRLRRQIQRAVTHTRAGARDEKCIAEQRAAAILAAADHDAVQQRRHNWLRASERANRESRTDCSAHLAALE